MDAYSHIVENQREFFKSQATFPLEFRVKQLNALRKMLQDNEQLLMDAISKDFKKSTFDTYTNELGLVYSDISEAIRKLKRWSRTKRVGTNMVNFPAKSYIIAEPLGVSLIIGAWNYPYQLSFAPVVAAMAAGCTIVLKPSELPANTSHVMHDLVSKYFPATYFCVLEGGVTETTHILKQKFDKIFFTGSANVGRIVYQAAAKHLTPVTLELGGKSPAFITESVHLKMAVKRLIWAKFLNAGQTCIAPDYVFVHHSIKKDFIAAAIEELKNAHYSFENENYVQIINKRNVERLAALVNPKNVVIGGKYNTDERYFEPTILDNVTFDDAIMQEEIFGPLLPIIAYNNLTDAINYVKSGQKPLSCYVFSKDRKTIKRILSEVSFGGGAVNESIMHITNSKLPFGGVGESGMGAYHGEAGFKAFTHFKSILDKPTWMELSLKYAPRTDWKYKLIKMVLK